MKHLLVIRFSALGDVAMTIPVIHACACQHPELRITVLSREFVRPLFERMPANVSFVGADLKGRHKGIGGLNRLFAELRPLGIDAVADLHDVLRSKYLRMRFRLAGIRTAHIDKGRREKKALTDAVEKKLVPLKSSFERYADVLRRLGLDVTPRFSSLFGDAGGDLRTVVGVTGEKGTDTWVGIAPFAAHRGKVYPLEQMEQVVAALAAAGCRVFLFGAGASERALLEHPPVKKFIAQRRPTAINPGYGCEYCVNNFFDCAVHFEAKGFIRLQLLVQGTICCREIECALTLCGTYKVGLFRLLISLRSSC